MNFIFNHKKKITFVILVLFILGGSGEKNTTTETSKDVAAPSVATSATPTNQPKSLTAVKAKGGRALGIAITEGQVDFDESFDLVHKIGAEVVELPVQWDDYEKDPGTFSDVWLAAANQFYPAKGTKLALSINPIDTNADRLPDDLKGKSFNDPEVISRYKSFIDYVAQSVQDSDIYFVSIGNEIDVYLGNSEDKWSDYAAFYEAVSPYVAKKFPQVAVGAKITFVGHVDSQSLSASITNNSESVFVTYYPFKKDSFIVRSPKEVPTDFGQLVAQYPGKKIYFTEIGYPSGAGNKSSEELQAEFITETFAAWDTYNTQIPFLNFLWLHDKSDAQVAEFQRYYGLKDQGFASYLATLGLRTYDGTSKKAFTSLAEELSARSW